MTMTQTIFDDSRPGSSARWRWLTANDAPLALARVAGRSHTYRPGDLVTLTTAPTLVVKRVGYRITPNDLDDAAKSLLHQPEVYAALQTLAKHTGATSLGLGGHRPSGHFEEQFRDLLRVGLAIGQRYGGQTRGLWCYETEAEANKPYPILSKRTVRLGERVPGGGRGEDAEGPSFTAGLSVVLLNLEGLGEVPAIWCMPHTSWRKVP